MSVANQGYLASSMVKQAFLESIEIMGVRGKKVFLEELQMKGLNLDENQFPFTALANILRNVFGEDVAEIITERTMLKIDKMYSIPAKRNKWFRRLTEQKERGSKPSRNTHFNAPSLAL